MFRTRNAMIAEVYAERSDTCKQIKISHALMPDGPCTLDSRGVGTKWAAMRRTRTARCTAILRSAMPPAARGLACSGDQDTATVLLLLLLLLLLPLRHGGRRRRLRDAVVGGTPVMPTAAGRCVSAGQVLRLRSEHDRRLPAERLLLQLSRWSCCHWRTPLAVAAARPRLKRQGTPLSPRPVLLTPHGKALQHITTNVTVGSGAPCVHILWKGEQPA